MSPPSPIDRVLGAIVPRAVGAVDIDEVVSQVDIDHLVSEVDVNGIVQRVDIDGIMGRVDIDALMARVDIDALMARVDIDALLARIDIEGLLTRIDLNALIGRVDLDAVLAGIDLPAVMEQAKIDEIVSNASRGITARMLDLVRRQIAAVDVVLISLVNRVFRRPREVPQLSHGTLTGRIAGGISRLSAYLIDVLTISIIYSLGVGLTAFLVSLFTGHQVDLSHHSLIWLGGYAGFAGLYYWIGLSLTGRSIGKGLLGLRVINRDSTPLSPQRAAVRTIVYPFSFILCIGLIPIVIGRRRRALHDAAAGSIVVYDWGDRPAELPGPVADWLRKRHGLDEATAVQAAELASLPAGPLPSPVLDGSSRTEAPVARKD
jgi:uncharacterized RDD family membrane protein YckC